MATQSNVLVRLTTRLGDSLQILEGIRFDRLIVLSALWLVGGLFVDGWAHTHGQVDDSFFTLWHAGFYSGFMVLAGALILAPIYNRFRTGTFRNAVPVGYRLSIIGVGIFTAGGIGDMIWHTIFGIEQNLDAGLSPTHIMLAIGMALILTSPLRAAIYRGTHLRGWKNLFPAVLSMTFFITLFMFFFQYAHPFLDQVGTDRLGLTESADGSQMALTDGHDHTHLLDLEQSDLINFVDQVRGITTTMLHSAILMGGLLYLMKQFDLPRGSVTLMFGLSGLALYSQGQFFLWSFVAIVIAGIVADSLLPRITGIYSRHMFAFAVPTVLYGIYFIAMELTVGIDWSIELSAGTVLMAALTGLLLSILSGEAPARSVEALQAS